LARQSFSVIYLPASADEVRSEVPLFPPDMISRSPGRAQAVIFWGFASPASKATAPQTGFASPASKATAHGYVSAANVVCEKIAVLGAQNAGIVRFFARFWPEML